jgi:D-alanine-D-alanine ligase
MRVLVLHSDVGADAPADEQDTLITARAIVGALRDRGHEASGAAFAPEPTALKRIVEQAQADTVFNLVESVYGDGLLAALVPAMLDTLGVRYTGAGAACLALAADKVLSKRVLHAAGLPTADWAEPPDWDGLGPDQLYIVKSVTEDASLGLDDGAVVRGTAVAARAQSSRHRHGGRWFAEAYLEGREFNVALLEDAHGVRVLPMPEMRFEAWAQDRPRIVGYAAKWDEASDDAVNTVRSFGIEEEEPALARALEELARRTWNLFGMRGTARIDFRIDAGGLPMILEANPNPCLEPNAGFAAAALRAGISYAELVDRIAHAGYRDL